MSNAPAPQTFAPTDHHENGPSTFPMRAECIRYQAPPEDPEDLDAMEGEDADPSAKARGTAKHKAVAQLLAGDLTQRQHALDGLSEREVAEVQYVVEKAIQIIEENGYALSDVRVEMRVTLMDDAFATIYFGTGDADVGPIDFEWKFGLSRNYFPQLAALALPKMVARGESRRIAYVVYGQLERVERFVITKDTAETIVYGILARRVAGDGRPTPCQYCGWCANRATCSALVATPVALVDRREDWALKLPSPHVSALRDPAWLGAARFIWKNYLAPWGGAVEFACSMSVVPPVGYNQRPEKGRTTVGDARKAFAALREEVGEDVLWANTSITLGSLVKAHAACSGQSEAKAKAAIVTRLVEAGALSVGEPSVKLIADKNAEELIRAAIGRGPAFSLEDTKTGSIPEHVTSVTGRENAD